MSGAIHPLRTAGPLRTAPLRTAAAILAAVTALTAQSGRDAYRETFQAWRQTDPSLEKDAGANADISQRAVVSAAAAARYTAARTAYLHAAVTQANQTTQTLNAMRLLPEPDLARALDMQRLVSDSTDEVTKQIATYADDADPALQPVRQTLARERAALLALSGSINERQGAVTKVAEAWIAVEQARARTIEPFQAMAGALQGASGGMDQEALDWAEYYRLLGESARAVVSANVPAPVTTGGVRINNPARTGTAGGNDSAAGAVRINNPAGGGTPLANNPAIAAPPSTSGGRYAGSWNYSAGGMYHGAQPAVVNMELKDENGKLVGTVNASFWPFGDIKVVTPLRFEFSGTPNAGRVQSFPLVTAEGAKGTIDLIPGPAFNLLEVNFRTDKMPGKVTQGNFMLIRR